MWCKIRWLGAALLDIDPRLRKVKGYKYLPQLRFALQRAIERETVKNDKSEGGCLKGTLRYRPNRENGF
jgi:hypothetical protein